MEQQLSAIVKHTINISLQLSATVPSLCPQHKSSLINRLINDMMLDEPSKDVASAAHQYLAQNFNTPARVALLRFGHLHTTVWNVRKSQVGRI